MLNQIEKTVLNYVIQGYSNLEISKSMQITLDETKLILQKIYKKLNVKNRIQAIIVYISENDF